MDFDFAVEKKAINLARQFSRQIKGAFIILDTNRGCARVVKKNKETLSTFDFADYRAKTIDADLKLRDFTINSLCVDLSRLKSKADLCELIQDRFKGRDDIKKKIGKNGRQFKFGVIEVDEHGRIKGFKEKPKRPKPMPRKEGWDKNVNYTLISMGNYTFTKDPLMNALAKDYGTDFGKHVIPGMLKSGMNLFVYEFQDENGEPGYWRDIGDLRAYHSANLDLNSEHPPFDLFALRDQGREIYTLGDIEPPSLVDGNSISEGCRISPESTLINSVISSNVYIRNRSQVIDSIIFEKSRIGPYVRMKNTIVDKENHIPEGMQIGYDLDADKAAGLHVDSSGIVVVPKAHFKRAA